jgi:hypothetical protein
VRIVGCLPVLRALDARCSPGPSVHSRPHFPVACRACNLLLFLLFLSSFSGASKTEECVACTVQRYRDPVATVSAHGLTEPEQLGLAPRVLDALALLLHAACSACHDLRADLSLHCCLVLQPTSLS